MLQRAQAGDLTKWWKLWTLRDMECIFIDRTLAGSMSLYFIFTSASKAYQGIVQFFEFSEIANDKNVIKINIYIVQTFGIKIHFKLENFPRVENQNFYGIARNIGEEKTKLSWFVRLRRKKNLLIRFEFQNIIFNFKVKYFFKQHNFG